MPPESTDGSLARVEAELAAIRRQQAELAAAIADVSHAVYQSRGFLARPRTKIRQLLTPKIGRFPRATPQPLRVPASYLEAIVPDPAPTISIVTPAFNSGAFLERTIISVLEQDYPALQYVVRDAGSDDGSKEILERHADRFHAWASEPDGGQANAIALGLAETDGEIMAYLNADDVLLPGSLAYVADYFSRNPDVDVVYGQRMIIDEVGARMGLWITPEHDSTVLKFADFIPQETLFWRRAIWDKVGGIDESFHFALDWDLLLRFASAGARFKRLPRLTAAFRIHGQQKTQSWSDVGVEECMRIRQRELGRPMGDPEAAANCKGYLRRSVRAHLAFRLREKLTRNWVDVDAGPVSVPEQAGVPATF